MKNIVFDTETDGLLDSVTKIHCIVAQDLDSKEQYCFGPDKIQVGLDLLSSADLLISQNGIKYDFPVIRKLYPFWSTNAKIRDTLVCTHLLWPDIKELDFGQKFPDLPQKLYGRYSLEAWGYRLGELKGEFGKTSDWQTFTPEMLEYCKQDVRVTVKLWDKIKSKNYSEQAIELEHQFAEVIAQQERHGFCFNKKAAVELYSQLGQRRAEIEKELQAMIPGWTEPMKQIAYYVASNGQQFATKKEAGKLAKTCVPGPVKTKHIPFNPSSRDHISRALIERHGWKPKLLTPGGMPQVDESVLSELPYPEAKLLNEAFLLEKRIGQLAEGKNAWLKLEKNGRIHGEVNTNGAVTGRCTHNKPNIAQVPSIQKGPDKQVLYGMAGGYGHECRSLFGVPPGFKLVGADLSGLELRCLAHYMARYDGGAYGRELVSGDIHTANQKAAGLPTRENAKTFIYGFLYGAGDEKIGKIIGRGAKEGKRLKSQFLKATPALARLRQEVIAAAQRGYLVGLDGRHLNVRSEHAALNTLLQSAGALIAKQATVFLYQMLEEAGLKFGTDWALVAHVHDELQMEVKAEHAEQVGKLAVRAMEKAGEHFQFRCPITGEYRVGESWAGTH